LNKYFLYHLGRWERVGTQMSPKSNCMPNPV